MLPALGRSNPNVTLANAYLTEHNAEFAEVNRIGAPVQGLGFRLTRIVD